MPDATFEKTLGSAITRDLAAQKEALVHWLQARWPGVALERLTVPEGSGASSELLLLSLGGGYREHGLPQCLVVRLSPQWAVYPAADLEVQARCMNAAAEHSTAPVPRVLAVHPGGGAPLGRAFLLMEWMPGRGAPDIPSYVCEGWLHDLSPRDQRTLWHRGLQAIAALHDTDVASAGLGEQQRLPTDGATPLRRMLSYWRLYLALVEQGGDYPALRRAVDWLQCDAPAFDPGEGLVWGDASLRNMLFTGLRPVALLDFEFAHLGFQPFDVAFYVLMDHVMAAGFASGAPRLPGFRGLHATLDDYERLTGRAVAHRPYLFTMALTYMALSTTRVFQRLEAAGQVSAARVADNPPLRLLGRALAGEPWPG